MKESNAQEAFVNDYDGHTGRLFDNNLNRHPVFLTSKRAREIYNTLKSRTNLRFKDVFRLHDVRNEMLMIHSLMSITPTTKEIAIKRRELIASVKYFNVVDLINKLN